MDQDHTIRMLERMKQAIYRDLDKAGNFRRVDEGEARSIVEKKIKVEINRIRTLDV
tara:strand:- start:5106 stop:5273 length:168 start_codon:yes stop_codon:yes gene_type:complete